MEGEPGDWVLKAVESVKRSLGPVQKGMYLYPGYSQAVGNIIVLMANGLIGVVFQFARVGNDKPAEEFLRWLDEESPVSQFVDTLSGNDLMDLIGTRAPDGKGYQAADLQQVCSS